jgi:peptidoglycan/xylan/chitin deacetylase (PgdA/CDA1 family)
MLQYAYRTDSPATPRRRNSQEWVQFSAIDARPALRWPNGARVALWVCPNILHYEYDPPPDPWVDAWARMPAPDVMMYGRQDYANRVGFWRMLEVLDRHAIRCTAVVNSAALQKNPSIRDAVVERGWAYLGHGMLNTRFVYGMGEAEESAYYREMRDSVESLTGVRMTGTGGPGPQSSTENTPDVLAALGFTYHGDWFHDDEPFPLRVRQGRLISMPYAMDTNDAPYLGSAFEADGFADMVKRQWDRLYEEGAERGKIMCLSLHPALFGQPQRIRFLEQIFQHICAHRDVWHATGDEIAAHYMAHHHAAMVGHLEALQAKPVPDDER